jgi:hypothetical protein
MAMTKVLFSQCALRLLVCKDVTANMAKVAEARRAARASRSVTFRVAREGRLFRFVYASQKLS